MDDRLTRRGWSVLMLEMVLIVASILLAFSLESWRNGREALELQHVIRETILEDFNAARPQLRAYIQDGDSLMARKARLLDALRDPSSAGVDSLQALFVANGRPIVRIPVPPSYRMAIAARELRTVDDPALMTALAQVDFADQMLAEHMRVSADIFYTGPQARVATRLGSEAVLTGGSQVPRRFLAADYYAIVSSTDVFAAAERMMIVNGNVLTGLKRLEVAMGQVIEALSAAPAA